MHPPRIGLELLPLALHPAAPTSRFQLRDPWHLVTGLPRKIASAFLVQTAFYYRAETYKRLATECVVHPVSSFCCTFAHSTAVLTLPQ